MDKEIISFLEENVLEKGKTIEGIKKILIELVDDWEYDSTGIYLHFPIPKRLSDKI